MPQFLRTFQSYYYCMTVEEEGSDPSFLLCPHWLPARWLDWEKTRAEARVVSPKKKTWTTSMVVPAAAVAAAAVVAVVAVLAAAVGEVRR